MDAKPTLIHLIKGNRWGGVEKYAFDICRYYHDKGWNVLAVTRDARAVDSMFEKSEIPLAHAPLSGVRDLQSLSLLKKKLKETEGEVFLHLHGFRLLLMAIIAKKLSGNKSMRIIVTRHKVKRGPDSWFFRKIYRQIDALVFVSEIARNRFLATWHNKKMPLPESRIHVLHNSLYLPDATYDLPTPQRPLTAMFHGPLKGGKGLETLIDALALLKGKRFRMRIVGSGKPDYVDKLRRRAISRGVMEMIDWHKHTDDPLPLIMECDFGVLPSVEEEAFGLANIEYMASGRPQVCSSNGAQPEYITDGREGFLVPPGKASVLADAMSRLISDSELRHRMGQRAYETFQNTLSWPHFIEAFESFLAPRREERAISH